MAAATRWYRPIISSRISAVALNSSIAVVPPRTDTDTELIPVSLVRKGDTLTFTYQEKTGAKVPYVMQPLLLVAVDRQYEAPNVVVKKK